MLAEKKYLKLGAHIRLRIQAGLKDGEVKTYIQNFEKSECVDANYSVDLFKVTIFFNGDLSTREKWERTRRAIVRELGCVIFFSDAAKRQLISDNEEELLGLFVEAVIDVHPFNLDSTRPRFRLVKLQQIVEEIMNPKAREVLPYLPKLLRSYLGPDGW